MKRMKDFITTSIIGGLVVLLPFPILALAFSWLFNLITGLIQPLTSFVMRQFSLPEIVADILALLLILAVCFIVGNFLRTRFGQFIHGGLEELLKKIPGYTMVKETLTQLLGKNQRAFRSVALIQPSRESDTMLVGFVTDDSKESGFITVFAPTSPNPTSGYTFMLPKKQVFVLEGVPIEQGMRVIIACGAGSAKFIEALGGKQVSSDTE